VPLFFIFGLFVSFKIELHPIVVSPSVNRKGVSGACSPGDLQRLPFLLGT
jgi:hypothetical protein